MDMWKYKYMDEYFDVWIYGCIVLWICGYINVWKYKYIDIKI